MPFHIEKKDSLDYKIKIPKSRSLFWSSSRVCRVTRESEYKCSSMIAESPLDDAQKFLLVNVVETYFELDIEETERFRQFLSTKGYWEVEKMEVTWADKMMEKGRVEGREQGREEGREQGLKAGVIEGRRETLLHLLTAKFGSVSEETSARVQALDSVSELDTYLERVLTAESIDDMGL